MSRLSERIENFNRTYSIYEIAVEKYKQNTKDILFHMSLVQAFELTFELSWKVLKDYILQKGIKAFYPKDVIKEAFANETIKDGELWIKMLETRNSISHEYKMEKVMIFGSRAKGNYRTGSDIDFAIWKSNKLSISTIAFELDDLPTPYKFDCIDYKNLEQEGIKNSIDKDGKLFYKKINKPK